MRKILSFPKHYYLWFYSKNWPRYGQTQESGVGSGLIFETITGKLLRGASSENVCSIALSGADVIHISPIHTVYREPLSGPYRVGVIFYSPQRPVSSSHCWLKAYPVGLVLPLGASSTHDVLQHEQSEFSCQTLEWGSVSPVQHPF